MSLFTGTDLTCIRGDRMVFRGLSFETVPGDALILIGPNGSGKSSLLRMMAGLLRPVVGSMAWNGTPVGDEPEEHRGRFHYVGHHDAVKAVLTVEENLRFWAGLRPDGRQTDDAVTQALTTLGIGHLHDVPGRFLSAGQKRRLNLARIMASRAPLWLLDEPTTALDKESIARLETAVAEHRKGGGIVVLSTHADVELESYKVLNLGDFAVGRTLLETSDS
ncbi:MAG: heme ABC exporter ATP-binding protein CcmA, partial [Rhodospirillales bacterium]|nr:heme ABC exporter ATP-binding protein CcmA [Rhodospirillales bacterium]